MKNLEAEGHKSKAEERRILVTAAEMALRKLIQEFGEDVATRAFSAAVAEDRRQTFCRHHGVKQINIPTYIDKTPRKQRPAVSQIPPATDHPSLWGKNGKSSLFVSQPYKLSLDDLRRIVKHCEDLNLDVEIGAGLSWHFPGRTILVVFKEEKGVAGPQDKGSDHDL